MMDVSMPNLDGVSATSLIRQFDAMTPIISMTGNSRPDEVLTYFSHGMNDVLPKPFTKEGMLSMLEKHLLHLKNIHQNPGSAPTSGQLDSFDPETFDPMTSENPFVTLGISNEDYLNILNGGTRWSGFTPSPSPVTAGAASGNAATGETGTPNGIFGLLGKRTQDEETVKDGHKRTRFQEL
jgi:osomolarity two-component system response regulator SKN7